jgi:hypothetical protein
MATTAAHRLVDRLKSGSVTIMMADRGFGNGTAVLPDAGNDYFLKGSRVKRPSRIRLSQDFDPAQDKFADGDIRLTEDETGATDLTQQPSAGSHGTKVTVPMVGDGHGPGAKPIHEIVLGTGKDAFVRVFKQKDPITTAIQGGQRVDNQGIALDAYCKIIQEATKDADAHVYVIERSLNTERARTLQQQGTLALHRDKIKTAYEAISKSGKLIIGAAWNEGENVNAATGVGIAANADAGFISPDNTVIRANLSGADEWKRRVMCVGAMENPFGGGAQPPAGVVGLAPFLKPGTREYRRRLSNTGSRISVTAAGRDVATVNMQGNSDVVGGTSSATPLVAGIAAELMLVDPSLKSVDNIHKVLEYIEATAEPIDKSPSDPSVVGAVGDTGHGRANFWKAVLAVANGGLPKEPAGRKTRPKPADDQPQVDPFFKSLALKGQADGLWYGLEIRASVYRAIVRFKNANGTLEAIADSGAAPPATFGLRPSIAGAADGEVRCYFATQQRTSAAGLLPSLPFSAADFGGTGLTQRFLARFSIKEVQLRQTAAGVLRESIQIVHPTTAAILLEIPVDIPKLRDPQNANNPAAIKDHVRFDSWVFHIDTSP